MHPSREKTIEEKIMEYYSVEYSTRQIAAVLGVSDKLVDAVIKKSLLEERLKSIINQQESNNER